MPIRLLQVRTENGDRIVAAMDDAGVAKRIGEFERVYDLAFDAAGRGWSIVDAIAHAGFSGDVDIARAAIDGRLLAPLDHPDPAHLFVTGTGLTHLGSASSRNAMHRQTDTPLTDSMRMFQLGLDGGKPPAGEAGAQPEWFYKGDGSIVASPGAPLASPGFALDGGEEPELVGLYVIAPDGTPCRIGFALGNEFSDHVTEKQNYLYLAHSKLRACSFGPEIILGDTPAEILGHARIRRGGETIWEKPFASGEAHMCHSIANLEHHHFKYDLFRRPGDAHAHYFGTATLSFSDGVRTQDGDVFEIEASPFLLPLWNKLSCAPKATPVRVRAL